MFELRPYQSDLMRDVKASLRKPDVRSTLLQSPTGSGKTVIVSHMVGGVAQQKKRGLFLVHRRELLDQTSKALWKMGLSHGQVVSGRRASADRVQVGSVQTVVNRLRSMPEPDLIIVDEAHHAAAATYRKILEHWQRAYVVGLTATPARTDGQGLDDLFDDLVPGPSVAALIADGWLSPYYVVYPPGSQSAASFSGVRKRAGDYARGEIAKMVDRSKIIGNAVDNYLRFVKHGDHGAYPSCLVYCVNRIHAAHVEMAYRAAGIDARYCAGDTPTAERNEIIERFKNGDLPVIVSVDLFGEGLDVPGLAAVQILRPTESLILHLQMIGRVLRVEENKNHALILDHVGNTLRHGLPDDDRVWTLKGRQRGGAGSGDRTGPDVTLSTCEKCFAVYRASEIACPACGHITPTGTKLPEEQEGELEMVSPEEHRRRRKKKSPKAIEQGRARDLADLVRVGVSRGYKPGWAGHVMAHRKGFKPGTPEHAELIQQATAIAAEVRESDGEAA